MKHGSGTLNLEDFKKIANREKLVEFFAVVVDDGSKVKQKRGLMERKMSQEVIRIGLSQACFSSPLGRPTSCRQELKHVLQSVGIGQLSTLWFHLRAAAADAGGQQSSDQTADIVGCPKYSTQ